MTFFRIVQKSDDAKQFLPINIIQLMIVTYYKSIKFSREIFRNKLLKTWKIYQLILNAHWMV